MSQPYKDLKDLLKKEFIFAIIGASNDRFHPGFQVYYTMKGAGYHVEPVNTLDMTIQGDPCFPNLTQLRPFPDVIVLAEEFFPEDDERTRQKKEENALNILKEMRDMGIFRVWMNPRTVTDAIRHFAILEHFEVIDGVSIIEEVEKEKGKSQK
ncbi:CoA-binding protein [Candidatus Peregrinibacteria bacterium]|nr:CoA-binding protein [Candidatus Peregrinibacteria bacterium]